MAQTPAGVAVGVGRVALLGAAHLRFGPEQGLDVVAVFVAVFVGVAYSPMLRGLPPAASASACSHQTANCVARMMIA